MSIDFIRAVQAAKDAFRRGRIITTEPSAIFLGASEHEIIVKIADNALVDRGESFKYSDPAAFGEEWRLEWNGMKVFKVDSATHISFARL